MARWDEKEKEPSNCFYKMIFSFGCGGAIMLGILWLL